MDESELKLEWEKLEFEKLKFQVDGERRVAEIQKIDAEREKACLEAEDLRVPYKQRSAYKTALFQGAVLVVAVISALVSVGFYKPIFEAQNAALKTEIAIAERNAAEKDKADAIKKTDEERLIAQKESDEARGAVEEAKKAKENLGPMSLELDRLENDIRDRGIMLRDVSAQIERARTETRFARVDQALLGLKKERDTEFETQQLLDLLTSGDSKEDVLRRLHVQGFASNPKEPTLVRLAALWALYSAASKDNPAQLDKVADYRNQYFSMALEERDGKPVPEAWSTLIARFGKDNAAPYVCNAYKLLRVKGKYDEASWKALTTIIGRLGKFQYSCQDVYWDIIDPELFPQNYDCIGFAISNLEYELVKCPDRISTLEESRFLPPIEGPLISLRQPGLSREEKYSLIDVWRKNNKLLTDIVREPGLTRLRSCSWDLWLRFAENKDVGDIEIDKYCPSKNWPQRVPTD